jgi:small subunit ribosomal protein S15
MYLTPEVKQNIFAEFGTGATDTVSAESQVALFTHRIKHLTEHLKQNKKDLTTKRSLINLVGKRRKMLEYLKRQDIERYRAIIKKLGIRK